MFGLVFSKLHFKKTLECRISPDLCPLSKTALVAIQVFPHLWSSAWVMNPQAIGDQAVSFINLGFCI